jgi:hypothetical protein
MRGVMYVDVDRAHMGYYYDRVPLMAPEYRSTYPLRLLLSFSFSLSLSYVWRFFRYFVELDW